LEADGGEPLAALPGEFLINKTLNMPEFKGFSAGAIFH